MTFEFLFNLSNLGKKLTFAEASSEETLFERNLNLHKIIIKNHGMETVGKLDIISPVLHFFLKKKSQISYLGGHILIFQAPFESIISVDRILGWLKKAI